MKRFLSLFAVLFFMAAAAPVFAAQKTTVIDDVIRMSKAGVSEDAIIALVERSNGRYEVNADDLIALTDAGASKSVVKAVVNSSDSSRRDDRTTRVRTVYAPSYGYYPYYSYDPFYDPFFYSPRVSIGFGFGYGRGYYGGGHYGGGHYGGHGRHR